MQASQTRRYHNLSGKIYAGIIDGSEMLRVTVFHPARARETTAASTEGDQCFYVAFKSSLGIFCYRPHQRGSFLSRHRRRGERDTSVTKRKEEPYYIATPSRQ